MLYKIFTLLVFPILLIQAKQGRTFYEASSPNLQISAMAEDGFHLGIDIYKEWESALSQRILTLK
jgi:hypothetical protein